MSKGTELDHKVAEKLAGRPVTVIFRDPPSARALGEVVKMGGRAYVYVSPNLPENTLFTVFLHELAHVRLHWSAIPETNRATQPARSIPPGTRLGDAIGQPVEDQADKLAADWLHLADQNADRYLIRADNDLNTARLMALKNLQIDYKGA